MKKLLLILFISGCSFKSLVIPNLPYILANRVDSSLHLYNDQEDQVKVDFKTLLTQEKVRVEQIKNYFNQIEIKNFDVVDGYNFFAKNYYAIAVKVNRILAKQFSKLDSHQIEKFKSSMLEKNDEILERIQDKTNEDYYERYEYFFGSINQNQKSLINTYIDTFKALSKNRLEKRKLVQLELIKALKLEDSKAKELRIIEVLDETADRSAISATRAKSLEQFKQFSKTLTVKQVEFFKERSVFFNEWIDEYLKSY
tara:strand:- start:2683 stop:3447 length:765 start_codon:yes stop_codon:yes gene_type:complete